MEVRIKGIRWAEAPPIDTEFSMHQLNGQWFEIGFKKFENKPSSRQ